MKRVYRVWLKSGGQIDIKAEDVSDFNAEYLKFSADNYTVALFYWPNVSGWARLINVD